MRVASITMGIIWPIRHLPEAIPKHSAVLYQDNSYLLWCIKSGVPQYSIILHGINKIFYSKCHLFSHQLLRHFYIILTWFSGHCSEKSCVIVIFNFHCFCLAQNRLLRKLRTFFVRDLSAVCCRHLWLAQKPGRKLGFMQVLSKIDLMEFGL